MLRVCAEHGTGSGAYWYQKEKKSQQYHVFPYGIHEKDLLMTTKTGSGSRPGIVNGGIFLLTAINNAKTAPVGTMNRPVIAANPGIQPA
jgi:hypothetical protein